jgi:amino acid transporter
VLSAIVALGLATSISAMVMVGPRIYAQMADDGVLPKMLRSGSAPPRAAIGLQVGLALVAFFLAELRDLLLYVGFLLGLSAAGTVACLFMLGGDDSGEDRKSVLYPWLPLIFIVATLGSAGFLVVSEPAQALAGFGTLAVGAFIFWLTSRSR